MLLISVRIQCLNAFKNLTLAPVSGVNRRGQQDHLSMRHNTGCQATLKGIRAVLSTFVEP